MIPRIVDKFRTFFSFFKILKHYGLSITRKHSFTTRINFFFSRCGSRAIGGNQNNKDSPTKQRENLRISARLSRYRGHPLFPLKKIKTPDNCFGLTPWILSFERCQQRVTQRKPSLFQKDFLGGRVRLSCLLSMEGDAQSMQSRLPPMAVLSNFIAILVLRALSDADFCGIHGCLVLTPSKC